MCVCMCVYIYMYIYHKNWFSWQKPLTKRWWWTCWNIYRVAFHPSWAVWLCQRRVLSCGDLTVCRLLSSLYLLCSSSLFRLYPCVSTSFPYPWRGCACPCPFYHDPSLHERKNMLRCAKAGNIDYDSYGLSEAVETVRVSFESWAF